MSFNKKLPFSPNLRCATTVEVALIGQGIWSGASQSREHPARAKTPEANFDDTWSRLSAFQIFPQPDRAMASRDRWVPSIYDNRSAVQLLTGTRFSAMKAKEGFDGNRASVHSHATGMRVARITLTSKISPSKPLLRCHGQ